MLQSGPILSTLNMIFTFMKKHWLANTHWIEIVKKLGPVGELIPGPLDFWSRTLICHCGPKGNLD